MRCHRSVICSREPSPRMKPLRPRHEKVLEQAPCRTHNIDISHSEAVITYSWKSSLAYCSLSISEASYVFERWISTMSACQRARSMTGLSIEGIFSTLDFPISLPVFHRLLGAIGCNRLASSGLRARQCCNS